MRGCTSAVVAASNDTTALVQPRIGAARDHGRIDDRVGMAAGLAVAALGCAAVLVPGAAGLCLAALLIGLGVGMVTPLGFAHLAATAPAERLGQTMGSAEVGRELGDAGGPLLVGAVAVGLGLTPALLVFGCLLGASALVIRQPFLRPPVRRP